jgi:probable F420-dependent oxidoreductase
MDKIVEYQLSLGRPPGSDRLLEAKDPPNWASIPQQVRDAEAFGFNSLVATETPYDPLLSLALASQTPSKLELVTGIAIALSRSPTAMAYNAWEVQRMSGGRLVLGLGSQVKGHIVRRFAMPWTHPALRMKEFVQAMRACWRTWQTGEPLNFAGEIYQINLMPTSLSPPPVEQPHIPIHIAAVGEMMLETAGEVCDGVRLHDFSTRRYIDEIAFPQLRKGFERAGRPESEWKSFSIAGGGLIITAKTEDGLQAAVQDFRGRVGFYASTRAYRQPMELEGWGDIADQLYQLSVEQRWQDMPKLVTEEMVYRFAAVATHRDLAESIEKRFKGISRIRLNLPTQTDYDRGFVREITAALRADRAVG